MSDFAIRPAEDSDLELIVNSWLESYKWNEPAKWVRSDDYYAGQRRIIAQCLGSGTTIVACHPESRGVVYGWCCYEPGVLHFVFVKGGDLRKGGVAKALLTAAGLIDRPEIIATHITKHLRRWMWRHPYRYNPYLLF